MSDNFILTSLWLLPVIGLVVVLLVPKRSEPSIKWVSLGFTLATFLMTLVALAAYLGSDKASAPCATGRRTTCS